MDEGIRIFVGIDVPEHVQSTLEDIQFDLMEMVPEKSINWGRTENMHVTLAFLGDGNRPEQVGAVCDVLDRIGEGVSPFQLRLGPLGAFPQRRNPKVIYSGLQGGIKQLTDLKNALDNELDKIGYKPEERKYTPHLTLGRVRKPYEVEKARLPFGSESPQANWAVSAVHLYHSFRNKKGQFYKKIHSVKFE